MPFYRLFVGWEGSPTKIDYRKNGNLILTSPLEDVDLRGNGEVYFFIAFANPRWE